jgi:hypothetical protein
MTSVGGLWATWTYVVEPVEAESDAAMASWLGAHWGLE